MTRQRFEFEAIGMGYRLWADDAGIEINVSRLKRSGQELQGEILVKVSWEGVKTVDGVLHQARFNFSSATTRSSLAKILKSRTESVEEFKEFDWGDALEHLCQYVLRDERMGEPLVVMNGKMPKRRTKYDIKPVVPHGVTTILYGPGGIGKSAIALTLALSIALGVEIIPGLDPVVMGPTLYLDYETDSYVVRERVEFIANGHDFSAPKNLFYRRCYRPIADDVDELSRIIAENGISFVVIDSCGPAMGSSSEYGDANEGTLKLFTAIRKMNCSTLLVDHVSKSEMKNRQGDVVGMLPYGSVYKINLSRAAYELVNVTADTDADIQIRLINTKANDSRLQQPIDIAIDWNSEEEHMIFSVGSGPSEAYVVPSPAGMKAPAIQRIVDVLAENTNGLTCAELGKAVDSSTELRVKNLDVTGVLKMNKTATVDSSLTVQDTLGVKQNLTVGGNADIQGNLKVAGTYHSGEVLGGYLQPDKWEYISDAQTEWKELWSRNISLKKDSIIQITIMGNWYMTDAKGNGKGSAWLCAMIDRKQINRGEGEHPWGTSRVVGTKNIVPIGYSAANEVKEGDHTLGVGVLTVGGKVKIQGMRLNYLVIPK
jgi:hypothetical protein